MKRRKPNAGAGYGYMFHGAFKQKKDAVEKEGKTPGSWVKGVYTQQGHRYVVMSPRENPRTKTKTKTRTICGRMIGGNPCSRKPNHKGPHLPQGATLRPKSRLPKGWQKKQNAANATALYTEFHGKAPDKIYDTNLPTADYGTHPELAQLGKLVSIMVGQGIKLTGKDLDQAEPLYEDDEHWQEMIWWGKEEAPDVAAEPAGRQIYLIGGNQDLTGSLSRFPVDPTKDLIDLGPCLRLEYFTRKKFDQFRGISYFHALGEETGGFPGDNGQNPRLVFDKVRKLLYLVGGVYTIKPAGITD
jgi:hypothetical protein